MKRYNLLYKPESVLELLNNESSIYIECEDGKWVKDKDGEFVLYEDYDDTRFVIYDSPNKPSEKEVERRKWRKYKNTVWKITEENKYHVPNIELREWKKYVLDHKISIRNGYLNNVPVEHIAHPDNLRIITHEKNTKKGTNNFIDDTNSWILI